jgi:hypothetical protein
VSTYRKKTTIEAVQWFKRGDAPAWAGEQVTERINHFLIATMEGVMTGKRGDWIAKGAAGEIYAIDNAIFLATYEKVE